MDYDTNTDNKILYKIFKNLIDKNSFIKYGKSFYGQDLIAFHKGTFCGKQFFITGGMHAREYISSFVVMKLFEDYDLDYGCFFIPLVNPDGINLCTLGQECVPRKYKAMTLRLNNNSTDFSMWKANGRGVDLNVNFDAMWGKGKFCKYLPGASGYIGERANSEPENIALLSLMNKHDIDLSIAYHSKGEVVYHGFEGMNKQNKRRTFKYAKFFAKNLKYKCVISKDSVGGLSDYLSMKNVISLTVELGNDHLKHPISYKYFENIYHGQYEALKKLFLYRRNHD